MNGLILLIPIALGLGLLGLAAFFWSLRQGQFEDLDGAALRIFVEDEEDRPGRSRAGSRPLWRRRDSPARRSRPTRMIRASGHAAARRSISSCLPILPDRATMAAVAPRRVTP